MKKIMKKIAKYIHRNAVEGAESPSFKLLFEQKVPKSWIATMEKEKSK